jgi:DNA-binding transcriptional regulator LsrR (DeoR family)
LHGTAKDGVHLRHPVAVENMIADHLGLTIETISRTITALRGEGIVLIPNTNQVVLRDMAALRALAAEG